jgi:cytoskeletal protein CcmA (bactofilin family)
VCVGGDTKAVGKRDGFAIPAHAVRRRHRFFLSITNGATRASSAAADYNPSVLRRGAVALEPERGRKQSMAGESLRIKGDVIANEDLRIEGQIEGTISISEHTLVVGPQARVNATVKGRAIIVAGSLTGAVTARERFELQEKGSLDGTLDAPRISVRDGAFMHAKVTMPAVVPGAVVAKAPVAPVAVTTPVVETV